MLCAEKVRGTVTSDLGLHEIVSSRGNKSRAAMFLMLVTEMLDEWPENHRSRTLASNAGGTGGKGTGGGYTPRVFLLMI